MNIPDDSPKGYILELDLSYPKELHDMHSDLPLAPEHLNQKLMTTLNNKGKYVLLYTTLKLYLKEGLKLEKIHKVLEFDQSDWMKQYIDFNTELRKKAKNEFEKNFFKLMNNTPFGKSMENIRNCVDIRLCSETTEGSKVNCKTKFRKQNYL